MSGQRGFHWGLLLLCTALALRSGCVECSAGWRLPLGIAPNHNTGALAIAADDTTLYTADSRGTIFAVEAKTGRVRWSIPGSASLDQIFVFPSIPELVYYTSWDLAVLNQLSLVAVRKDDGHEMARLRNLSTGNIFELPSGKVVATDYGLAILHGNGVYSTDPYLNVQWEATNPLDSHSPQRSLNHLAASGTLIATVARPEEEAEGRAVSFDARTGRALCNISNVTDTMWWAIQRIPFVITENDWSLMDTTTGSVDIAYLHPRVVDLRQCLVRKTRSLSATGLTGDVAIIPRRNNSDPSQHTLFFSFSRTVINETMVVNWTITRSELESNDTIWNLTIASHPANPTIDGGLGQPPLLTNARSIEGAVVLWYAGTFSIIDTATGAVRWSLAPTTVPTSPPLSVMDPQTVFPLGDGGRLFIPNLQGYTVVDTYSGEVLEVDFFSPILATVQFRDGDPGNHYVVYVNHDGTLIGVQ